MAKVNKYLAEYRKQRKRVLNYISRAKKKGYTFDISIPSPTQKPTKKDLQFFQKLNPEKLREKGYYASSETGEVKPAKEAFKELRKEAAKKAAKTRRINKWFEREIQNRDYEDDYYWQDEILDGETHLIDQLREQLDITKYRDNPDYYRRSPGARISTQVNADYVLQVLDSEIAQYGEREVAHRLANKWDIIEDAIMRIMTGYNPNDTKSGGNLIISAIRERALTQQEAQDIEEDDDSNFDEY